VLINNAGVMLTPWHGARGYLKLARSSRGSHDTAIQRRL
jgi:hypothetical protein